MTRQEHESRRQYRDRPIQPDWKKSITLDYFRKLTWLQRIQIFFGYSLRIEVQIVTVNSPGRIAGKLNLVTTKNYKPEEEIKDDIT